MGLFRKSPDESVIAEVKILSEHMEAHCDSTRINCLEPRKVAEVVGTVEHVATVKIDGSPAFEIAVSDGTGSLVALWTGRSAIACVTRGQRIALWGRVAPMKREDSLVVYNPRYELLV